jgi:hypothetical protein
MPHQGLGPARLTGRGFSPPHEISYRGVKLARVSVGLGRVTCAAEPLCRRWAVTSDHRPPGLRDDRYKPLLRRPGGKPFARSLPINLR